MLRTIGKGIAGAGWILAAVLGGIVLAVLLFGAGVVGLAVVLVRDARHRRAVQRVAAEVYQQRQDPFGCALLDAAKAGAGLDLDPYRCTLSPSPVREVA